MNWVWLSAQLNPVAGAVAAAVDAYGRFVEIYTPQQLETAIQSGALPAAPRSRAEMASGLWTPEDALEIGQRETLIRLAERNAAARANANQTVRNPVIPPAEPEDWTIYYILGAVAATGILIAIARR